MFFAFTELYLTVLFCFTELSFYSAFVLHLTIFIVLELVSSYLQSKSTASEVEKSYLVDEQEEEVATGVSCQLPFPAEGSKKEGGL